MDAALSRRDVNTYASVQSTSSLLAMSLMWSPTFMALVSRCRTLMGYELSERCEVGTSIGSSAAMTIGA